MTEADSFLRQCASDDDLGLTVFLAELSGVASLALAEQAVEVAQCVEAARVAYLADRVGRVDQSAGGIAQPDVNDVLAQVLARAQLEEAAEGRGRHAYELAELL